MPQSFLKNKVLFSLGVTALLSKIAQLQMFGQHSFPITPEQHFILSILSENKELYQREHFKILSKEEYIDIVIEQLELLRPEIVIHRITGDPKVEDLIEPKWLIKKFCVLNDIDKEMVKRDTYQGKKAKKKD